MPLSRWRGGRALVCGVWSLVVCAAGIGLPVAQAVAGETQPLVLESPQIRVQVQPDSGVYELTDKRTKVTWSGDPRQARLGSATLKEGDKSTTIGLQGFRAERRGPAIVLTQTLPGDNAKPLVVRLEILGDGETVQIGCTCDDARLQRVRLLDGALWTTDTQRGSVLLPVRLGMLIPADSGKAFGRSFPTSGYEGCHCQMVGLWKSDSAALVTWSDVEGVFHLQSVTEKCPVPGARQVLLPGLELPATAALRIRLLGQASFGQVGRAYRQVARERGLVVPWEQKIRELPRRELLLGASNVKLWTCLNRRMDEESQREESVRVEWTFDQAAQIAEHLKRDLQLDRVLFILGGWTNGGYDCRHPDILPAAPECGGTEALADCARRVHDLGYILGLHDNYQDMYRDAASWSEDCLMQDRAGKPRKGGRWLGGRAWLTCSLKALELARRPQNLPDVCRLIAPEAYFIDTTYAVGLQECFHPQHPLTRAEDLHWKQELSRYARELFGIFGSECGREWAIPCSDFFEGLSGVSGRHYHDAEQLERVGARPLPIFEMIYHDCIQVYGKYGYRAEKANAYVLSHLLAGRPLHYHQVPPGLYWQHTAQQRTLPIQPNTAQVEAIGPRRIRIRYPWTVRGPVEGDWRILVHFTTPNGRILAQNDHAPKPGLWSTGQVSTGPFEVNLPDSKTPIDIRVGLFQPKADLRAVLTGPDDGERRYLVGRLQVRPESLVFEEPPAADAASRDGLFVRADDGWAEGLHPLDRFMKNTHEILAPVNRLSAQMLLTEHQLLTADGLVRRSVFGDQRIEVVANLGEKDYTYRSQRWGDVVLPPDGFLAHGPEFLAFHAREFQGRRYERAPLFTVSSPDGAALEQAARVRIFHGFGDPRLTWQGRELEVKRELIVPAKGE